MSIFRTWALNRLGSKSPQDVQGIPVIEGLRRILCISNTETSNSLVVPSDMQVPPDEIWQINALEVIATPTVPNNVTNLHCNVLLPPNVIVGRIMTATDSQNGTDIAPAGSEDAAIYWQGSIFMPPNYIVQGEAAFTLAGVDNSTRLTLFGLVFDAKQLLLSRAR